MNAFESELGRRLQEATEGLAVSPALARRTLMRARRRRRTSGAIAGLAGLAAVAAVIWAWPSADSPYQGLPPARIVPEAHAAQRLGPSACTYGHTVRARARELPGGALCAWVADADLDGDGRSDRVFSYGLAGGPTKANPKWLRSHWRLRATLATGETLAARFSSDMKLGMPSTPRLVGSVDADGDGDSEVFLATDVGNGATLVLYALDGRRLAEVFEPPRQFAFTVTGGVNLLSGLSCENADGHDGPELVVRTAQGAEGGTSQSYETSTAIYRWTGDASLEQVDLRQTTTPLAADELAGYSRLDCAGLEWRP